MKDVVFTDEQRALIERSGSVYVEACPGAGKTQSIVERYIQRPNCHDRRGVALLSFTRAAVEEARRRCMATPELLESPNFIGTIDSFINRFIVTPVYTVDERRAPTFRDSWESAPATSFELPFQQASDMSFELSWFKFDQSGNAEWYTHIPYHGRKVLQGLPKWILDEAARTATTRWQELTGAGFIDSDYARDLMYSFLGDSQTRVRMSQYVRDRFCEVIVDEIQDCDSSDIYLLQFILDSDVDLVMVGDPEQSIYGFRGSSLAEVIQLSKSVPNGERMSKNFRSSPSICKIVDSLRHAADVDEPAGPNKTVSTPVYVMHAPYLHEVSARVNDLLKSIDHPVSEFIYLAHAEWAARKCAGAGSSGSRSKARLARLASAAATLHSGLSGNSAEWQRSLRVVQAVLRDLSNPILHSLGDNEFYRHIDISSRAFHDGCIRLIFRVDPRSCTPDDYLKQVCDGIEALGWTSWLDMSRLRKLKDNRWPDDILPATESTLWSTVHRFKGLEFPGVGLVIPRQPGYRKEASAVEDWELAADSEGRRVLYVGASRAERLLVIIVDSQADYMKVQKLLTLDAVPFQQAL